MTIEEYLVIRENLKSLNSKITDWAKEKFNFNKAAKLLGFIHNDVLVFDDENDMDCLLEYLIFHSKFKGTQGTRF